MIPTSTEELVDRMMTEVQITNEKLHQPFGRKQGESNVLETPSRDVDFNELKLVCRTLWKAVQLKLQLKGPLEDFNTEQEEEVKKVTKSSSKQE